MGLHCAIAVVALVTWWMVPSATASEVHGVVRLEGQAPQPTTFTIKSKSEKYPIEHCGDITRVSQGLLVDPEGGLQNAVVWLEEPPAIHPEETGSTVVLNQLACEFMPHVLIVPPGGRLAIRNSDPILHNIRIFHERTMLIHEWQKPEAADLTWQFETPGPHLIRCGVHSWMHAWVFAAEHPYYAVTDASGTFRFAHVPAGPYTLHTWHETLGRQQQPINVEEGNTVVTVRLTEEGGL